MPSIAPSTTYSALITPGRAVTVAVPSGASAYVERTGPSGIVDKSTVPSGATYIYGPFVGQQSFAVTAFTGQVQITVAPGGVARGSNVVQASRTLTAEDSGLTLECTAAGLTLTVPAGLPPAFGCTVIPNGTTSIAASGSLLNGAATTITRTATSNPDFNIVPRASALDAYVVTGS